MAAVAPPELKRLAFVETAAMNTVNYVAGTSAFNKACTYYCSAKEKNLLKGSLTKIEDLIKAYGSPVVSKVAEKYPAVATHVDDKVDVAVTLLQDIWKSRIASSTPATYAKGVAADMPAKLEAIKAAREDYFKKIEATLETLKAKAVTLPTDLKTGLTTAIADARAKLESAHLFERVKMAYETVLKYPAVVAVIEKSGPVIDKAAAALATVQASPYYVKAVDAVGPYVTNIKERLYPAPRGPAPSA